MWWFLVVILSLGLLAGISFEFSRQRKLRPLLFRPCSGIRWHRRFPDVPPARIRDFLNLVAGCLGIGQKHRLAFRPDDRVMDIYRALYPPKWSIGDAMELEDLATELDRCYGMRMDEIWHEDITLGELFDRAKST